MPIRTAICAALACALPALAQPNVIVGDITGVNYDSMPGPKCYGGYDGVDANPLGTLNTADFVPYLNLYAAGAPRA